MDSFAVFSLARCFHHGLGTRKDVSLSSEFYEKAESKGHPDALTMLNEIKNLGASEKGSN